MAIAAGRSGTKVCIAIFRTRCVSCSSSLLRLQALVSSSVTRAHSASSSSVADTAPRFQVKRLLHELPGVEVLDEIVSTEIFVRHCLCLVCSTAFVAKILPLRPSLGHHPVPRHLPHADGPGRGTCTAPLPVPYSRITARHSFGRLKL